MQIWVRDDAENSWIECNWVLAQHSSMPFGLEVLHAVLAGLQDPRRATDLQVLRRTEAIHEQLQAGPAVGKNHDKRQVAAASRNLTQRAMRSKPPAAMQPELTAEPDLARVETPLPVDDPDSPPVSPLQALGTTDGW